MYPGVSSKAFILSLIVIVLLTTPAFAEFVWKAAPPESQGMSASLLDALRDSLATKKTESLLVIRHDRIVYEWYSANQEKKSLNDTGSMAQALVGGLSLAVALGDGRLSLDDRASKYIHEWRSLPGKSRITIRQLATRSSGIEDAEQTGLLVDQLTGWKEIFWKRLLPPNDPFTIARDLAPVIFTPGTFQTRSNNTGTAMLAYAVTTSLKGTPQADIRALLRDRIMRPIGVVDEEWSIGYGKTFEVDGLKLVPTWGGASYTARAIAGIGRLMLHQGNWQRRQLIDPRWILATRSPAGSEVSNDGLGWWTNADSSWGAAPLEAFGAAGDEHQFLMIVPSLDLIVVRSGAALDSSIQADFKHGLKTDLVDPLLAAVLDWTESAPPMTNTLNSSQRQASTIATLLTEDANSTVQLTSVPKGLWIRANSGTLSGRMAKGTTYASGSLTGELIYPNFSSYNSSNATQADAVTYAVNIPASGTWFLWARMYYPGTSALPTNDPNSFWAAIDGRTAKFLGNLTTKDKLWHWESAGGSLLSLGTVASGSHTLKIWNREARESAAAKLSPRLDMLFLTSDPSYMPNDAEARVGFSLPNNLPYPPSPVIQSITWDPSSTIVRKATGSDCWPITWANDGNLYTAYGDGMGFDPKVPIKLSLGFARVTGSATAFSGVNIRSATGEQKGDGKSGKKPSGMLMVNGTLYMWARNANLNGAQSQLAWSTDHAATWSWGTWKFAQFGYLTFLNFGRNYSGARDGYVYAYSHDNPSAYTAGNRMILLRVPQNQIKNRAAYQFLKALDASGNPIWTSDINQRGAVFTYSQRCLRSGISYNPALRRYLWWQQIPKGPNDPDTRFSGGFGIYDAPQPWGPWTTAYFTESWDVGPGETASFPQKWMSSDGKTLYLVFSGNDSFSVRKATLKLR